MVAWCHGAAGIAMALTRAVQHGLTFLTPALERALHYVRIARARQRERRTLHFGLCHGLLGNLDAQLVAERAGLATADNSADDDVQFVLQALLADTEGGLSSACEQHGLFCGMTGVGYGLLRYLDDATPCVLAPTISASRPWMKSAADGLCANERPLDAIRAATGVGVQSDAARFLVIASLKRACRAALERGEMTRSDVVVGPYLFVENGVAVRFDGRTHQTRPASALRAWLASAHGAAERERPLSEEERLLLVDGWLAPRTEMERLPEWLWPRAGKEDS